MQQTDVQSNVYANCERSGIAQLLNTQYTKFDVRMVFFNGLLYTYKLSLTARPHAYCDSQYSLQSSALSIKSSGYIVPQSI